MASMNAAGSTVWLNTPLEVLADRLLPQLSTRPLLQAAMQPFLATSAYDQKAALLAHLRVLYAMRQPFYAQAQHLLHL